MNRTSRVIGLLPLLAAGYVTLGNGGCNRSAAPVSSPPPAHDAAAVQPAPPANGARFSDVTQAAGIDYKWVVEGKRPLNILQTIGNGCALFDYNGDGNLDVLLVGPQLKFYAGDGKGHFTDVTHETGLDTLHGHFLGCTVGDYDNDGFDDLYITAYRGGVLLHNEPAGGVNGTGEQANRRTGDANAQHRVFRDVTTASGIPPQQWGTSAAFVDVDGDGKLDLFVCGYAQFGPNTQPQLCNYSGHQSACGPRFYQPEKGHLYHNDGGGRFHDITKPEGVTALTGKDLGATCADYDGSGRQSVYVANDEVAGDLLQNKGRRFENVGASSGTAYDNDGNVHGGMGADWGDYDNDGKLDLIVGTFQHEAKNVYHNEGGGFFEDRSAALGLADKTSPYVCFGIKFLDFDNDGWLDIVLANGHVQDNINDIDKSANYRELTQLFHNLEGKSFEEVGAGAGPAFQRAIVGRGLAVGDFDNDGRQDILVVDSEGSPMLLHNETPDTGHWLTCKLQGVRSNRDGIGALVTFEAGGRKMVRRCAADGSYMSASDLRVHCGLGSATTATVTVKWPSGGTTVYKNMAADKIVTLKEGAS